MIMLVADDISETRQIQLIQEKNNYLVLKTGFTPMKITGNCNLRLIHTGMVSFPETISSTKNSSAREVLAV